MEAQLSAFWAALRGRFATLAAEFPTQPDSFVWTKGATPFSDERWVIFIPLLYVLCAIALQDALGGRSVRLGPLPALHNAVLALGSAAMFVGTALEALQVRAGAAARDAAHGA